MNDNRIPRICDFGLMRIYLEEGSSGLTTTTAITGTDRYMAPELVFASDDTIPTAASDVWAAGCVGLDVSQSKLSIFNDLVDLLHTLRAIRLSSVTDHI
jgi:serine/threonine protein kinase